MTREEIVTRFEEAVRELAFKGTQMPEDHAEIERNYRRAKQALYRALKLPPIIFDAEEDD